MSSTMSDPQTPPHEPPHRAPLPPGATPVEWIRFACPTCGKRNKAPAQFAGKVVYCARCQHTMTAPSLHPAPQAEPAQPTLHDLSAHVAAREAPAKPRKGWPLWLMTAHLALPVGTIAALWYLRQTGHLPWVDPYLQQLKVWLGQI